MTRTKVADAWSCQAGVMVGSDIFIDSADNLTSMGGFKWAPPGSRDSVLFSFIVGNGRFAQEHNFNNPEVFDLVYTHTINSRLTYNFETLFGFETNVPGIGTANWERVLHYLTYAVSPRVSPTPPP